MSLLQIMKKAEEEGEVFIATLSPDQLKRTGFEAEKDFWNFEYVDIYLMYDNGFKLKYVFNGDPGNVLYEKESEVGGPGILLEIVLEYLSFT